jgi:hypothetical protein
MAGLTVTASALATESSPRDPAAAEVLFRDGRSLVVAGDYPHACPKFAESLRLDYAPGTLLNLADCEEHTGRIASAWAHFRDLSTELPSTDERQPLAVERANALEPRMSHLTVRYTGAIPSSTRILRDGVELRRASLDLALPVDPGLHTVVVMDDDRERSRVEVEVREGQSQVLNAESSALEGARSGRGATRTVEWLTGGLAVTAFATGAAFGISALSNSSAAGSSCTNSGVCSDAAGARAYDDAHAQARIADVALGIGLVATAVTGALLLSSRRSDTPQAASVTLAALIGTVTW